MATLDELKVSLLAQVSSFEKQPLSDEQYSAGFQTVLQGSGWATYQDFIVPQLAQVLARFPDSHSGISVLEIGPGPRSVLGLVRSHMKKIKKYAAFEPNNAYATKLEEWIGFGRPGASGLPSLGSPPDIRRVPFEAGATTKSGPGTSTAIDEKFDLVLFCHSMYGMHPKRAFIERALELLAAGSGLVIIFHSEGHLHFDGLVCHQTTSFPTGEVNVPLEASVLDTFAAFIAGFTLQDSNKKAHWRENCLSLGRRTNNHLTYSVPEVMVVFNEHANKLQELLVTVPSPTETRTIKSPESRLRIPAATVQPTEIRHVQDCVRWASRSNLSLSILSGSHSGNCIWNDVVAIDMSLFNKLYVVPVDETGESAAGTLVVAGSGCKTGDIIRETKAVGLTIPLGARPSVGAGLWLQGGIGHLARQYGLTCDAIVGAVLVGVDGRVLCIGSVPTQHQPSDAVRPENETGLLWALKGAGTNIGIVISVTFRTYPARIFLTHNWIVPLDDMSEAKDKLVELSLTARNMHASSSVDMYLYWSGEQVSLGVTLFEFFDENAAIGLSFPTVTPTSERLSTMLGLARESRVVDGIGLFKAEMYVSGMHGGHGGGKTSSFKRCLFLKDAGAPAIVAALWAAVRTRQHDSPLSYIHLLHGGGAIGDVPGDATAFGCRDWTFACVVTGVWDRGLDGTSTADDAVKWVYSIAKELLPSSCGVYGADLGPDPRDSALAMKAFGPNLHRLRHLKHNTDPKNVLAYVCPLPSIRHGPKLIILVTGKVGAGKDYCAGVWADLFSQEHCLNASVVSISDATKREYAALFGADHERLIHDRTYKEQHRPAMTRFFQRQVQENPRLPEEHFLGVVHGNPDVDVLLITGMRDEAPVSNFWHMVPGSNLVEVRVNASEQARRARGGLDGSANASIPDFKDKNGNSSHPAEESWRPDLSFDNNDSGEETVKEFAEDKLVPFFHTDLSRLASMVSSSPDCPRKGMEFRHILDIAQRSGGLDLCTHLLHAQFVCDWSTVHAVVCCDSGGFVFGGALAVRTDLPLVLIREAGKLPAPTFSVNKEASHISSHDSSRMGEKQMEMNAGVIPAGASVVVVDDVLATGKTLWAILRLLNLAGVDAGKISVMVVAEFPSHRGRHFLRQHGFGKVRIQNLLVFGGS